MKFKPKKKETQELHAKEKEKAILCKSVDFYCRFDKTTVNKKQYIH